MGQITGNDWRNMYRAALARRDASRAMPTDIFGSTDAQSGMNSYWAATYCSRTPLISFALALLGSLSLLPRRVTLSNASSSIYMILPLENQPS